MELLLSGDLHHCTGWLKKSKLLYCVNSLLFLSYPVYVYSLQSSPVISRRVLNDNAVSDAPPVQVLLLPRLSTARDTC